jgi:IS4 transposase
MLLDPMFDRFINGTPLTVMTRALLENTLRSESLDELFERLAIKQYTRELHFSTIVHTMLLVACRVYKSPRGVYVELPGCFPVTLKCFYEKLQGIELHVMREMVRSHALLLQPIIEHLNGQLSPLLPGYRVKILDGNALAATDHRIRELRNIGSGALPGKSLVVLDPQLGLAIDVFPCEDGHAQERSLIPDVLETVEENDCWIEDRNFCTVGFLFGVADRLGYVLVREHAGLPWQPLDATVRRVGRTETGEVFEEAVEIEQEVSVEKDGRLVKETRPLPLRRIVIQLDEPTRDGETSLALLTNVKGIDALVLARLYLKRWTIEALFNVLTTTLNCEQKRLGYPKAALFGFCVTLLASNMLAGVKAALRSVHGEKKVEEEVSLPKVAEHVVRKYDGMMIGIPAEQWEVFRAMTGKEMADCLRELAAKVDLRVVHKTPAKKTRKKAKQKPKADPRHPHVSTARVLAASRKKQ